jgi:two-component system chemotaxis sensor kinase CheA
MDENEMIAEIQTGFLAEAADLLDQTEDSFLTLEKDPENKSVLESIFRLAHNLKGTGKAVGFDSLSQFAHLVENLLVKLKSGSVKINSAVIDLLLKCNDRLKQNIKELTQNRQAHLQNEDLAVLLQIAVTGGLDAPESSTPTVESAMAQTLATVTEIAVNKVASPAAPEKSTEPVQTVKTEEAIKIALPKIENLLNYLGEQVILQSALEYAKQDIVKNQDLIIKTIGQLSKITYDLQHTAIALRMVSVKSIFSKMERVVRDTAKEVKKTVHFIPSGETHELDKTILDAVMDPLVHMLRNAVDHGIESAEDRVAKGKPPAGNVWLSAFQKGGAFYIEVRDDGKGLDKERILSKAKRLGLIPEGVELADREIYDLIFMSGFSTHEVATNISGRGVGMDVVRTSITKLKGSCELSSEKDRGTTFLIKLPLTLAIFNGMIVRIGDEKFAVPNSDIEEAMKINTSQIRKINERESLVALTDRTIPLVQTGRLLSQKHPTHKGDGNLPNEYTILVTRFGDERYGLVVDELITQQRIVHKNLGTEMRGLPGVAGGTILGDGTVALILETSTLIGLHKTAA